MSANWLQNGGQGPKVLSTVDTFVVFDVENLRKHTIQTLSEILLCVMHRNNDR